MRHGAEKIGLRWSLVAACALVAALILLAAAAAAQARVIRIHEFRPSAATLTKLRDHWANQLIRRYGVDRWAPMRFNLNDRDLRLLGLPPKRVLLSHRYRVPTAVYRSGKMVRLNRSGKAGGKG